MTVTRTVVTLTCEDCEWGWCTDRVTRNRLGWWDYDAPEHRCPNGAGTLWERVAYDAEFVIQHRPYWAKVVIG
jgi:hypothetical protein